MEYFKNLLSNRILDNRGVYAIYTRLFNLCIMNIVNKGFFTLEKKIA